MAFPRSCGGNASSRMACESGCMTPPVRPWMIRNITSTGSDGAIPHKIDADVKPAIDKSSRRLRPNTDASQLVIGSTIALAAMYDVSTHVDSSTVADKLPAMCERETFTTVVSSTTMKVPHMTATAVSHGLTNGSDSSGVVVSFIERTRSR